MVSVVYPGAPDYLDYVGAGRKSETYWNKINVDDRSEVGEGGSVRWRTELREVPFERKGYETQFEEVIDAMAISYNFK